MANPSAGNYYILCRQNGQNGQTNASTYLCLDSLHRGTDNGDDLIVWEWEQDEAQIWVLSYDSDGNAYITAQRNNKGITRNGQSGTDVWLWEQTNAELQQLAFTDSGSTSTVDGTSYTAWYLTMGDALVLECNYYRVAKQGRPVNLATKESSSADQQWLFVPVPTKTYPVEPGNYRIYNGLGKNLVLDACNAGTKNGNPLMVFGANLTNAQAWTLRYRKNGTAQISSLWCGKCVDIPGNKIRQGNNLQLYTDNDARAQSWNLVAVSGKTLTVNGTAYQLYKVVCATNKNYLMEVNAPVRTAGSQDRVCLAGDEGTSADQWWAFVPIPSLERGGVYEIRPVDATSYAIDVASNSNAKGANVQLYKANGSNAQKFLLQYDGDDSSSTGWTIRHIGTNGQYLEAASNANGANVRQWSRDSTRLQNWKLIETGTKVVNGKTCITVEIGANNASNYMMDVTQIIYSNGTNIMIHERNEGHNQIFALVPTTAIDSNRPAPYSIALAYNVGSTGYTHTEQFHGTLKMMYPTWKLATSLDTYGPNCTTWRYRIRKMIATSGKWGSWSSWTAWAVPSVTVKGTQQWYTAGIRVLYSANDSRNMEVEIQAKTRGADERANIESETTDQVCQVIYHPLVEPIDAMMSPDGLVLTYATDYPWSDLKFYITSMRSNKKGILKSAVEVTGGKASDGDSYIIVPLESLKSIPTDSVTITAKLSTDQWSRFGTANSWTWDISDSIGEDFDVTQTDTEEDGFFCKLDFEDMDGTRVFAMFPDGASYEVSQAEDGSWYVPYSFYGTTTAFIAAQTDDDYRAKTIELVHQTEKRGHAFAMPDGQFAVIWLREGQVVTEKRNVERSSNTFKLNGRERDIVSFGTVQSTMTPIEGVLVPGAGSTDADMLEDMVGKHCLYRSPFGRIARVAVLSCDTERNYLWTSASVNITEEETLRDGERY